MFRNLKHLLCSLFVLLASTHFTHANPVISVQDGMGQTVTLSHEAHKIIALTPHAAELLYSAGAGSRLVGVTQESDYPEPVRTLSKVGSYNQINPEAIVALQPDLVVAWQDGGQQALIQQLRQQGIAVFVSHPMKPQDIATEIHALGKLVGMPNIAEQNTAPFRQFLASLSEKPNQTPINSTILVGYNPLFAISNQSFLGQMLQLCGGTNVFGQMKQPAFTLNQEALRQHHFDVVFVTAEQPLGTWQQLFAHSQPIPKLTSLNADLRPSLRIKSSLQQMCLIIDAERRSRH